MRISSVKVAKGIEKSKTLQKGFRLANRNPSLFSNGLAFLIATTAKPLTIMATPMKDKNDKIYGSARAIGTGIADLAISLLFFIPLNKKIIQTSEKLIKKKGSVYFNNPRLLQNFKSLTNRFSKLMFLPFFAILKFSLLDPVAKIMLKRLGKNESK